MNVNKKLWSFIFGCLIAASFVWVISLGNRTDVIEYFHQYPDFVIDYYALMVTAFLAVVTTLLILFIMNKVFDIYAKEHPFWLILPSVIFILLTIFTSKLMLFPMLSAAIPALIILMITTIVEQFINFYPVKGK